jgi:hypothetical protein
MTANQIKMYMPVLVCPPFLQAPPKRGIVVALGLKSENPRDYRRQALVDLGIDGGMISVAYPDLVAA